LRCSTTGSPAKLGRSAVPASPLRIFSHTTLFLGRTLKRRGMLRTDVVICCGGFSGRASAAFLWGRFRTCRKAGHVDRRCQQWRRRAGLRRLAERHEGQAGWIDGMSARSAIRTGSGGAVIFAETAGLKARRNGWLRPARRALQRQTETAFCSSTHESKPLRSPRTLRAGISFCSASQRRTLIIFSFQPMGSERASEARMRTGVFLGVELASRRSPACHFWWTDQSPSTRAQGSPRNDEGPARFPGAGQLTAQFGGKPGFGSPLPGVAQKFP